jgi:3-hydroxy-3-methylglutaryl CoA synthase
MSNLSVKEVKNNVDVDEEMNKDLLLRQSRLLYPEVEDFILNMAIEAYVNELKREKSDKMPEIN